MKQGFLSQYFKGVAAKKLSAVETNTVISNQREYNGVTALKSLFGTETCKFETRFVYLNDDDDDAVTDIGFLTWYDAREAHPTRSEHRLYFSQTTVSVCASQGDDLFIGLRPDKTVLVIIAEGGSTISSQLRWLFGIEASDSFSIRDNIEKDQEGLAFASRLILEQLGIELESGEDSYLEDMVQRFGNRFPSTNEFSEYARLTLPYIHPGDNPDVVLVKWIEREEELFRSFERHLISERINKGFTDDVEGFLQFSLSVHNRRKSRAGFSLENHLERLFDFRKIKYDRNQETENKSKPDFIFPSICAYHDNSFQTELLTMLGAKSTCKDRWRQVLSEASRIEEKHLLTFEAAISENQTDEMESKHLQLVVPKPIQGSYSEKQQKWLKSVAEFIEIVQFRQRAMEKR